MIDDDDDDDSVEGRVTARGLGIGILSPPSFSDLGNHSHVISALFHALVSPALTGR